MPNRNLTLIALIFTFATLSSWAQSGGDFQRTAVLEPSSFVKAAYPKPTPNDAQMSGSLLYVAYGNDSSATPRASLCVYNVADPANPVLVSELTFSDRYFTKLAIDGKLLYAAGIGITVFDLTTAQSPRQVSFLNTAPRANGQYATLQSTEIDVFGNYVFVDDGFNGMMSLSIFNSGNAVSVVGARTMQGSGYRGMAGVGNTVFSLDDVKGYFSTLSAYGALTATGTIDLLGDPADIALDAVNGRAWVTSEAIGPAYIYNVDIKNATATYFTVTSVIPHPGLVQYANNVLIVRDSYGKVDFYTVDVSQPNTISVIKTYKAGSSSYVGTCFRFFPSPEPARPRGKFQTFEIWKPGPALIIPAITTQPAATTVAPGANVSLSVVATGSPTLTYQWKKNGTAITGATSTTLALPAVTSADDATYTVTVTNLAGSVTSTGAKVTVSASAGTKPALTSASSTSATVGQTFSYTATFSGSPTSLAASGVPAGLSFNTSSGVLSGTPTTAGSYTVVITATNAAGAATGNLALTVAAAGGAGTKPALSSSPTAIATVGQAFSYTATFSGSPSSVSATGLPAGLTFNATSGVLSGTPTTAGSATVTFSSTNGAGTSTNTLTLTIAAGAAPPATPNWAPPSLEAMATIRYSGRVSDSLLGNSTDSATFTVLSATTFANTDYIPGSYTYTRTGPTTARITYSLNTFDSTGAETEEGMVLISFLSATTGTYSSSGSYRGTSKGTSYSGTFTGSGTATYQPPPGTPSVTTNPVGQIVTPGSAVTLSAAATGIPTYQWQKDDVNLPGKTGSTLTLSNVQATDNGVYSVLIKNNWGGVLSDGVTVGVPSTSPPVASALSNLSVRTTMAAGQTLIVGAVLDGARKSVLIRGVGPALNQFGLSGMADPKLELYATGTLPISANDDWAPAQASTFASVGAFGFGTGSRDAAISQSLNGAFTVQARGTGSGTILVEAYDVTGGTDSRFINLSARNRVGTGADIMIAGFGISGTGKKQLLIRAVGATLAAYGVPGALSDPMLTVFDSKGTVLASNDDWNSSLAPVFTKVGAFPLASSRDAAILVNLDAGSVYTVQVAGVSGTTGEALVEVYEVP